MECSDSGDAEATVSYPEEGAKSGDKFCRIEVTALPENLMNCNCRMSPDL